MPLEHFDAPLTMTEADTADFVPALRAFAWSFYSNPYEADILVQKTLTEALRKTHRFSPGTNLHSWLFTIMRHIFFTEHEIGPRALPANTDPAAGASGNTVRQAWSAPERELADAIHTLPRSHREVIVLTGVLGLSDTEAAEICGCETGAVKSRLSCARSGLLEALRARGAGANSPGPVWSEGPQCSSQSQEV